MSLDKLFSKYPDLLEIARRIARTEEEAIELTHDTLEKVSKYEDSNIERILEGFNKYFGTVMWRSYHGKTGSYRMKVRPVRVIEREDVNQLDEIVILRELLDAQYRRLAKKDRVIFMARFEGNQSVKEIARCMGVNARQTRTAIREITLKVRHGIAKECITC